MTTQPTPQPTPIKIVLLAGWSRSGKDTAADFLSNLHDMKKLAFADAPKIAVAEKYNFPLAWTKTQDGKSLEIQTDSGKHTVRELIIEYAMSERAKNPFSWAEVVAKQISQSIAEGYTKFVISDWRFLDELIGLQRELYSIKPAIYTVRITRVGQIISPVADKSEYGLLGFPFWIHIFNPGDSTFFDYIDQEISGYLTE